MTGVTLKIDIDHRAVTDYLTQLSNQLDDSLKSVFADIGEHLLISHTERWAQEQAPDGTPWADLSPDYRARKPKNKDKKLVLDGYLRDLLRYQASDTELLFGTDRPYGAVHQFGAKRGEFAIALPIKVKAHARRQPQRDVIDKKGRRYKGGVRYQSQGVGFVKEHIRHVAIPWGDIPARPWLGLSTDDEAAILSLLEEYLVP
jgi:phage virion morphogenesis protein